MMFVDPAPLPPRLLDSEITCRVVQEELISAWSRRPRTPEASTIGSWPDSYLHRVRDRKLLAACRLRQTAALGSNSLEELMQGRNIPRPTHDRHWGLACARIAATLEHLRQRVTPTKDPGPLSTS